MKSRTRARGVALQVLYEFDIAGHPLEEIISARLDEEKLERNLEDFTREIVYGVTPIVGKLDEIITEHAPEWPLDQVAIIDRNILRIALWEFAVAKCTPIKVAINEAIEMAKNYGGPNSSRFINGVLGTVFRESYPEEASKPKEDRHV